MVARLLMPSRGADDALPGEMLTGCCRMLAAWVGAVFDRNLTATAEANL